jgi:iron-sulfur cluster assembly protein
MQSAAAVSTDSSSDASSSDASSSDAWAQALARTPSKGLGITSAAAAGARERMAKRGTPNAIVRLGVKGGGCSGFSYVIQFDDDPPRERDYGYEVDGVRFVVDKKSLIYLAGSVFDYEKTLMFQGFKFRNPNEASSCGCGHSFTVR